MKVILVAGMPGSGKEEFLTAARNMDIPFLRMGDIVREYHAARGPEDADLSVGQLANAERERHGKNVWAMRALERMSGDVFLIDGCRSMDEVRAYRELTDDVSVVAIHSSPSTRYNRLVKRARDDAPKSVDEFRARDTREIGWGLAETIALSDILLVNEGSLESFHSEAARIMEGFRP